MSSYNISAKQMSEATKMKPFLFFFPLVEIKYADSTRFKASASRVSSPEHSD